MIIRIGFDIELTVQSPTTLIHLLNVHSSRENDLVFPANVRITPNLQQQIYRDAFANICTRITIPAGVNRVRLWDDNMVLDRGELETWNPQARQLDVHELPASALQFLLASRYCEVDSELMQFAWDRFGSIRSGAERVNAVCDFVHQHLRFEYSTARATRTAREAFNERVGVCRDFAHLAITLCRCLNIPARYVTSHLADIGVPKDPSPGDFAACMEVYLEGGWYTRDPRHNARRIGRIPLAKGRDAGDVPITMVFGQHRLEKFHVVAEEVAHVETNFSLA